MAVVSDSFQASGVININGVLEPDQIPPANHAAIDYNNIGEKNNNLKEEMKKKKKKAGPLGFFRAALVVLRSDNKNKSSSTKKTTDNDDGNWKKIVGSMRPLHLQDDKSPPPSLPPPSPARNTWDLVYNHSFHSHPPSSPSSSSSVSGGTMSQYASAVNLQALDDDDGVDNEDEDPDVVFDAIRGDEMIDYKAEEYIAQFYQRMKMDNHHHHHHHQRAKSDPF